MHRKALHLPASKWEEKRIKPCVLYPWTIFPVERLFHEKHIPGHWNLGEYNQGLR